MPKTKSCRKCKGTGLYGVNADPTCWRCGGTGRVKAQTIIEKHAEWIDALRYHEHADLMEQDIKTYVNQRTMTPAAATEILQMLTAKRPELVSVEVERQAASTARRGRLARLRNNT